MRVVGYLSNDVIIYLESKGIVIANTAISLTDDRLKHMHRPNKKGNKPGTRTEGKNLSIPLNDLAKLPKSIASPQAILWDINKENLLYIFPIENNDKAKIAININFRNKGATSNSVRSGSITKVYALRDEKSYEVIQGKI